MTNDTLIKYEKIRKEYNSREISLTKLGIKYGVARGRIALYFKSKGDIIINHQNKLKFDNTVFDKIDTEEKAYWLGFIFADGYVSDNNEFEVGLKLGDKNHLEKLRTFLKKTTTIKTDHFRCRLSAKNSHFVTRLKQLGCVPRKSLILKFPTKIPSKLIHHFVRGYFDGDGCFHVASDHCVKNFLVFSLLGTKEFLLKVKTLIGHTGNLYKKSGCIGNTFSISSTKSKAIQVGKYLYKDATIYLERKYNIYKKFKDYTIFKLPNGTYKCQKPIKRRRNKILV